MRKYSPHSRAHKIFNTEESSHVIFHKSNLPLLSLKNLMYHNNYAYQLYKMESSIILGKIAKTQCILSTWSCWLNESQIRRINSFRLEILFLCICYSSLKHCPFLSTSIPHLPQQTQPQSSFETQSTNTTNVTQNYLPLAKEPSHLLLPPA